MGILGGEVCAVDVGPSWVEVRISWVSGRIVNDWSVVGCD